MRGWLVGLGIALCGFALGMSGAPGQVMSTAATWLDETGRVELRGPVGDVVKDSR